MGKPTTKPKSPPAPGSGKAPSAKKAAATSNKGAATSKKTLATTTKAVSTAARTRAESLLAEIERRKQRIAEDFYDIGVNLRELSEKKLFGALGYPTFAAMLADRKVMSLSQAHRLIRIVRTLPRDKALAVGSEKAALLTGYSEATPEPDTPEWLLDEGTLPGGKRVADASTREIATALKEVRAKSKPRKKTPEETAAQADARKAQAALRKRGAKGATVEVVRRAGGFWLRCEVPATSAALFSG